MEELIKLLQQADDEYLTGLSNRGMIKRAYKDLEQETPEASWGQEEIEVRLKDAVCRIRVPLGSSTCSCPSRNMCRHRIAAILFLRRDLEEGKTGGQKTAADGMAALEKELLSVPPQRLRQACRTKVYREFLAHMEAEEYPEMEEGSTVTVRFPWENTVVKLLSPLEYSSCTCHSKELCAHKAQAVLAYQIRKKAVTLEQLKGMDESRETWDTERISQASRAIREGLRLQFLTGLSRLSPEAEESMERLAVICHGAGLPAFESRFRSAADGFRQYFARLAAFREEDLMRRLLFLYRDAVRLERAREPEELRSLAGTFRDVYERVPRLHLTAMGSTHFKSSAGYEGERYYFLDTEQPRWYTWTDARPSFYEGVRRRPAGEDEHAQAPWGLNCSRGRMMELEFYLTDAKAAKDGRLSVSQETKSEIVGPRNLCQDEIRRLIVWDYRKILQEPLIRSREPVMAGAVRCRRSSFDTVRQRFDMEVFDPQGRCIHVAVNYSKEEQLTVRALERLSVRMEQQKDRPLVFFGIPYLEDGRICLYPVEYFEGDGLEPPSHDPEEDIGISQETDVSGAGAVRAAGKCLREIRGMLTDLFQSGLQSVQPETVFQMSSLEKECGGLGLHLAEEELSRLRGLLEEKQHQMRFDPESAIASWIRLTEYLDLGLKKTELDLALAGMQEIQNH